MNRESTDESGLARFVETQESDYACALAEIRNGRKRSHWMWYIFPQLEGLGHSSTAKFYGIKGADEAKAFLAHPILGPRLIEITNALLGVKGKSAEEIFGYPDVLKMRSCATLFAQFAGPSSVFQRVLEKYYDGQADDTTIQFLKKNTA
ncbi:MAG TPA: DUF1810 domain-containing protein [Verrucomicrobiae bacterium]